MARTLREISRLLLGEVGWWLRGGWRIIHAAPRVAAVVALIVTLTWPHAWALMLGALVVVLASRVWRYVHPSSHLRAALWFSGRRTRRRLLSEWPNIARHCGLCVLTRDSRGRRIELAPRIVRASATWPHLVATVQPVRGHTLQAVNADRLRVEPSGTSQIQLTFTIGDVLRVPFKADVAEAMPTEPSVVLGRREDGKLWRLALGPHTLVIGSSGAGKGSVFWSFAFALAGGARAGTVRLYGIDLKGGMEVRMGEALFAAIATDAYEAVALLELLVTRMQQRTKQYAGRVRSHVATVDEPLEVIMIDELAALTAYLSERELQRRAEAAINLLCSQGRAPGFVVFACLQDPRKEIIPSRGLFTQMVGLRLKDVSETSMVLGETAAASGAHCHRIPRETPGVGYVLPEDMAFPIRVRAGFASDQKIRSVAEEFPSYHHVELPEIELLDDRRTRVRREMPEAVS